MAPQPPPLPLSVPSGGGGSGGKGEALYGLKAQAQAYQFDLTGITDAFPGVNGKLSGKDLLDQFFALGNSPYAGTTPDDAHRVVAAIQTALLQAGSYYPKEFTPTLGIVTTQDAKAFAQALNNLYNLDQAAGSPGANGTTRSINVTQFLTSQATLGVNGGPLASQSSSRSTTPTAVSAPVDVPNPEDLSAVYRKVAQQVEGRRPSAAETAAFVANYSHYAIANQKANILAEYNARVQKAQAKLQSGTNGDLNATNPFPAQPPQPSSTQGQFIQGEINSINNPPAPNLPHGVAVSQGPDSQFIHGSSAGQTSPATPDLTDEMSTLQDIINQRAGTPSSSSSAVNPKLILVDKVQPESADVAAENFARNTNPKAAAATDLNNTFQQFLQLLSGKIG